MSDLGEPQTEEKAAKKAETSKRRESILKALDDVVGSNADAEGWVELPIIRDLFVKTEGDPSQSAEAARKMFERALIDADKAGLIETMGSRGEKKLRKTRRTLDKDPP